MDIVFRIYDNCLASGIEAMFAFSIALLLKNESALLKLKFDELLAFLNTKVFEIYEVRLHALFASLALYLNICARQHVWMGR